MSVLNQDPGRDEMQIEVIDDTSPNGRPTEFIRKLAGEHIDVLCEPRNLGLAGMWNRCIGRACGEWVHILYQNDLVRRGLPVVGIAEGGVRETIIDGVNGFLVPTEDPERLGNLIEQLMENVAQTEELRRRGRQHVINAWAINKATQRLEQ